MAISARDACEAAPARRLSDRFAEWAGACDDARQLRALLGEVALDLGFHFFALVDHASMAATSAALIRIDNYPEHWVQELLRLGQPGDDPVHAASRCTNLGFQWSELATLIRLNPRHRHILERSRHHGLEPASRSRQMCRGSRAHPAPSLFARGSSFPSSACAAPNWSEAMRFARRGAYGHSRRLRNRPGSAGARSSACVWWRWAKPTGK